MVLERGRGRGRTGDRRQETGNRRWVNGIDDCRLPVSGLLSPVVL
jgi:hypothetical protein